MKLFSFLIFVIGSLFCLMFSNVIAETVESTEIVSISHTKESGDVENISFVLAALVEPRIFLLKGDKPRLVLDFTNCYFNGQQTITLADGVLSTSIRSGFHKKPVVKTRVVIDLSKDFPIDYSQQFQTPNNTLIVKLTRKATDEIEKTPIEKTDSKQVADQAELDARPLDKKPIPPVFTEQDKKAETVVEEVTEKTVNEAPGKTDDVVEASSEKKPAAVSPVEEEVDKAADKVVLPQMQTDNVVSEVKPIPELSDSKNKEYDVVPAVSGPVLRGISFDDSSNRGEMVLFHLNDFFPPTVSAIEKDNPRVLCDFNNMRLGKDVKTPLVANGKYVERIRAAKHKYPDKVRVVLDLVPDRDYDLQQVFFKNDNLFVLIINELPAVEEKE